MAELWRLHLRPVGKDPKDVVRYCLKEGILGVGWRGPDEARGMCGEEYMEKHRKHRGKVPAVRDFMRVKEKDLIWARDAEGGYLLGRVKSMPEPRWDCDAKQYDMHHVVSAHIVGGRSGSAAILDNEVPGLVKARFSQRGAAFRRIIDDHSRNYSYWLFAKKTGAEDVPPRPEGRFIDLLDYYDLEDLVVLYLQNRNWRVVLSSHAPNTPRYEVTLIRQKDNRSLSAGVQVKQKGQDIDASEYGEDIQVDQVFLFAASCNYGSNIPENVTIIHPDELVEFTRQNLSLLPETIKYWWDCSSEAGTEG